jgi:thermitase
MSETQGKGLARPVRTLKKLATSTGSMAVADRIVVYVDRAVSDADMVGINQRAAARGAGVASPVKKFASGVYYVDVSGSASVEIAAQAYRAADARVLAASPDTIGSVSEVPSDPLITGQWAVDKIDAPRAWNRSHGDSQWIAILDSGINESHPDLAGKVGARWNVVDSNTSAGDTTGHGTHVAGIAAANTNNAQGIAGVGYNAGLMNVKITDDEGDMSASSAADGIFWAVNNGANIINLSVGGTRSCHPWWIENIFDAGVRYLRDAIDYAYSQNVVVVAAAGNSSSTAEQWPASCPHVLSVANTNHLDAKGPGTTTGSWVSVAAPGTGILSTAVPGSTHCQTNLQGAYAECSGTSMAAPHVSGVAALVRASCGLVNPDYIVERITSTADPIAGTGVDWKFGRVNAFRAVCVPTPNALAVAGVTDSTISLSWYNGGFWSRIEFLSAPSGSGNWTAVTLPKTASAYTASGLIPGASYDFKVRGCEGTDCSAWSSTVSARANWQRLNVAVRGFGKVVSTPAGILCGFKFHTCSSYFPANSPVTLAAYGLVDPKTHDEYDFDHWEGACSGTGSCTVTISPGQRVLAAFIKVGNSGP